MMKRITLNALAGLSLLLCTAAHAQGSSTTLNLKDAEINSLIATVSDVTGHNFIVDPRVKGKVTVMSSTPMSPDELYGVFLAVLQVHGFAAVPAGPVIKIVPEVGAKQDGGSYMDYEGLADDEVVTRVVEIENVPAAQLVPILRPLVPQYGHLAAYSPSNMLIMSDRAANVERLTQIIHRIDQSGDREIEIIRLQYASAADVQRTLSGLLQSESKKQDPSSEPITVLADERTNSILLGGDKSGRVSVRAIIAHLDIPLEEDGDTQVIYLRYANAETLAPILEGYVQTKGSNRTGNQANQAPANTGDIRIVAEPDTNALVITASPKIMRGIKNVITQLDIPRAQVLVEAILAEVSMNKSRQLGIDWAVLNGERIAAASILDDNVIAGAAQAVANQNFTGLLRNGLNVGGGRIDENGTSFVLLLNALYGDGDTNILSTPSLVTMDNEEAEISVGQEVPFLTGSYSNNSNSTGVVNPFQTIERRDVGLTLGITPQINEGDTIQLKIKQEASSVSAGSSSAVDIVTNKRTLNTTVMVNDGDILVLGGLIDDNVTQSEQKVPILGDIPLLGALFRSTSVKKVKQNLMIFIRSVILRDRDTANYYSQQKYDYMRNMQLDASRRGTRLLPGHSGPQMFRLDQMLSRPPATTTQVAPAAEPAAAAPAPEAAAVEKAAQTPAPAPVAAAAEPQPAEAAKPTLIQANEPVMDEPMRMKMGRGHLR